MAAAKASASAQERGMLKYIGAMLEAGDVSVEHLEAIRNLRNPFAAGLSITAASRILGEAQVATYNDSLKMWGLRDPTANRPITVPFSDALLAWCHNQNECNNHNWRLVYLQGIPLADQMSMEVTKYRFANYLEGKLPQPVLVNPFISGYRLINFRLCYRSLSWGSQQAAIERLRPRLLRVPEAVLSEAVLLWFWTSGKVASPLEEGRHLGPSSCLKDCKISLEWDTSQQRLGILDWYQNQGHSEIGACTMIATF